MDMARGRLPPVIIIMVMDMVDMAMDTDMERGKLMLPLATIIMVMVMDMDMDTDMERGRLRPPPAIIIMVMVDMVMDMDMDMDMERGKPPPAIIIMVMVDMVMDTMVKQYLFISFSKFCCIHWNLLESSQQKHRPLFKKNKNSFFEIKRTKLKK